MNKKKSSEPIGDNDCVWCVDFGAPYHTAYKKNIFTTFNKSENVIKNLFVANGYPVKILGKGDCCISVLNDKGLLDKLLVKDVLYMPSFKNNLLSVQKLTEMGYKVLFENDACYIQKNNKTVAKADFTNGFYTLNAKIKESNVLAKTCNDTECIHGWHRRMGHENSDVIGKILKRVNIKLKHCEIDAHCEICLSGTIERVSFNRDFDKQSRNILDVVHVVNAKTNMPTFDNYVDFVIFIDDYSEYCVLYFLRNGEDNLNALIEYILFVRNKFNRIPTILSSDSKEDSWTSRAKSYMTKMGIKQHFTTESNPQSLELAYHRQKCISEMIRCMILDANLPIGLWGEALKTANFIRNRISRGSNNKSPYEIWDMNSYDIGNLKVFGSEALVWIPTKPGNVLKQFRNIVIFIGYDEVSAALRFMDVENGSIIISSDYKFLKRKKKQK